MDYHSSYPVIMQLNYYKVYHSTWWASIMDCADIVIDRAISPKNCHCKFERCIPEYVLSRTSKRQQLQTDLESICAVQDRFHSAFVWDILACDVFLCVIPTAGNSHEKKASLQVQRSSFSAAAFNCS